MAVVEGLDQHHSGRSDRDGAGGPESSTGSTDLFFQPLPLLVLVGVDWQHRRVEKCMLDPAQSIHFTSTLTYGKVKGTLPSCFSLPSRTRIVVFNFVIFTDGPQRFPEVIIMKLLDL